MAEYIEREALLDALEEFLLTETMSRHLTQEDCRTARNVIKRAQMVVENIPAADVAPVRHGKWVALVVKRENWKGVLHDFYQPFSCSICQNPNTFMGESAFCPHCGARMNGAE